MKKILLVIVSLVFMGCALDETYNNHGSWSDGVNSITFNKKNTLSIKRKLIEREYSYYIKDNFIYIKKSDNYIRYFKLYAWSSTELILSYQKTNYLLIKNKPTFY